MKRFLALRAGAAFGIAQLVILASVPADATSSRWQEDGCWGASVTGSTGTASNYDKAKQRARGNWEAAVRKLKLHKQRDYAHKWNYARSKKYACRKDGTRRRCNAKAVPCGIREVSG